MKSVEFVPIYKQRDEKNKSNHRPASFYQDTGASHWSKSIIVVITQDAIDKNWKRQIKYRTLYTCRLFLLTRIYRFISNWAKVFWHLFTLFLQYT